MISVRASVRFLCLGVALGTPLASTAQTAMVVVPAATQQPPPLPTVTPEVTKPLEGRLFFSPQQRQQIDTARRRGFVSGDNGQLVEAPPSVLNGFVKRSDGNTAVWVDGDVRWNANSRSVGSLSPGDVGGPSEYVKSASGGAKAVGAKPGATTKKPANARSKNVKKYRSAS